MASEEHLTILNQGVDTWNAWRLHTLNEPNLTGSAWRSEPREAVHKDHGFKPAA